MKLVAVAADVETTVAILRKTYGPTRVDVRGARGGIQLEQAELGPVRFDHVDVAMDFDAAGTAKALVFAQLISGRLRQSSDGTDWCYRPGDVFPGPSPGRPYTATVQDADLQLTVMDPALPSQVADPAPSRAQAPVTFSGCAPVGAPARKQWEVTCAYLRDSLLAHPEAAASPLVVANAARLLVTTALATFPNNALIEPAAGDRQDASPATLRRAVSFIDEHAGEDITVADVAVAARVTVRAVQLAFHRHLGTTPTRYLRQVRLDRAHRQLVAADPARETVTSVAYQWGFGSSSRFAAYYRTVYGTSPANTLRNR